MKTVNEDIVDKVFELYNDAIPIPFIATRLKLTDGEVRSIIHKHPEKNLIDPPKKGKHR